MLMTGLANKWPLTHLSINVILLIPPNLTNYNWLSGDSEFRISTHKHQ